MKTKPEKPKVSYAQEGGDDGCCYVVRVDGKRWADGLTLREARAEKTAVMREWEQEMVRWARRHPG